MTSIPDDAMVLGSQSKDAADLEVLEGHGVAVKQHDRRPFATIDIVEPHPVDFDERACRRGFRFSTMGVDAVDRCACDQRGGARGQPSGVPADEAATRTPGGRRTRMRRLLCGFLCHSRSTIVQRTKLHLLATRKLAAVRAI